MADPITEELLELCPDEVLVEAPPSTDGFGDPGTYGRVRRVRARVRGQIRNVRDEGGDLVVSSVHATLMEPVGATVRHRYTLPDRFAPTQPKPIAVSPATDENGAHHEVVYFK